eukprot:COSAG01_NODE_49619_length_370_cov_4.295203_1_plen_63_part_01
MTRVWYSILGRIPAAGLGSAVGRHGSNGIGAKGAQAVLTKLVWENMKTRCATSRQRLLSRLTT